MSTIKGVDCIRIQRYNENSNAGHNAQPDMYTATNARSLIYIQSGVQSMFNEQRPLICKIMKKLSLLLEFEAF